MARILLLSDIHANFPALQAVYNHFVESPPFTAICNCGDSLVYAPFANETLHWLQAHNVSSILGNTDRKVIKLLKKKSFKKPSKPEKRIMYDHAAKVLTAENRSYLLSLKKKRDIEVESVSQRIALYHGSPDDPDEFLFPDTEKRRFIELAAKVKKRGVDIVVTGHSHCPYYKKAGGVSFINPGSVGRMFDGNPQASCAVLEIIDNDMRCEFYRITYPVNKVIKKLQEEKLPQIYQQMYRIGRKLN